MRNLTSKKVTLKRGEKFSFLVIIDLEMLGHNIEFIHGILLFLVTSIDLLASPLGQLLLYILQPLN